ncbi:MAG: RsmE family RNA methyltransferase [Archangium sp.]|nr:RsmE family RNA methyltransferase [Archangium sp.]
MIRLLVPGAAEGQVSVSGPRLHYLLHVLRVKAGDVLEVFDGEGLAFDAKVLSLGELGGALMLGEAREAPRPRSITIVQGLPKAEKLELVLQKCTELGASAFAPASCARSVVKLDGKEEAKLARWQRIVEEAARQCGRATVPQVFPPKPLLAAVAALPGEPALLVLDEEERSLPLSTAVASLGTRPLALIIGPEGGLTREEVNALTTKGAIGVTLGRLVLRTETAALAALAVLRHLDGELG